jgi:CRP-like cAMP-binding protein
VEREKGLELLGGDGWLAAAPSDFRSAILLRCAWQSFEPGAPIQMGGEKSGELIGLAHGIVELRTILGRADTPLMHLAHPVFWFGYAPLFVDRPRRVAAVAKTPVGIARVPRGVLSELLASQPQWWRCVAQLGFVYGDISQNIAADLLIRDSERRCAAVLLRLCGRRFAGPDDNKPIEVSVTQDDLAGAANLSRNSVGTMMQRLAARGLIERGYRGVKLRAPAGLRDFVDQE